MQVQFDLQQMSTNAWFIIFTRPIHLSLSLSLYFPASRNYHAKFYIVNTMVLVFTVMEMKVEDKSKFFDALISLMQWGGDMSASGWRNYQSTESSVWWTLVRSFYIYILYDLGMLNIPKNVVFSKCCIIFNRFFKTNNLWIICMVFN